MSALDAIPAGAPDAIIVIFGAAVRRDGTASQTLHHRVDAASRFAARFARPVFIPTGGRGRYGEAEALVMARLLDAAGHKAADILIEDTATDTLSSVRAVRRLLLGGPRAPVWAATSAYHLPRCVLLLRLAGINANRCPPPPLPASTKLARRWYWRLRESPALPYDAALILWLRLTRRL